MPIYEEIPLPDLDTALRQYAPCWGTLEIVAAIYRQQGCFVPMAIQIRARDDTDEYTYLHGTQKVPDYMRLLAAARRPFAGIELIKRILNRRVIEIGGIEVSFEACKFGRAAFLGHSAYDYLYAKELHPYVDGWPKLFLEASFENRPDLDKAYQKVQRDFDSRGYDYPTLSDACNHMLKFRTSSAYYAGVLSAALKIPVRLDAAVEGPALVFSVEVPKALVSVGCRLRYLARSPVADRYEELKLPSGSERGHTRIFASSVKVEPGDQVVEVLLALGGRWLTSVRLPAEAQTAITTTSDRFEWDAFISHASEDKDVFVRHLAHELVGRNIRVWYDEFTLKVGDSLRRSIDKGLASSRYGIVVLSQNFFAKEWPRKELDGLASLERDGRKIILPVWLDVKVEDVTGYSPVLADRVAAKAKDGMEKVVTDLLKVLREKS